MNPSTEGKIPRWVPAAFSVQIALALFCPPIPYGERMLFPSDFWFMAWVALAFAQGAVARPLRREAVGWTLLLSAVWAHGYWRVPVKDEMYRLGLDLGQPDQFDAVREAFIAFRFLIWILAARIASKWSQQVRDRRWTAWPEKTLAACLVVAGTVAFLAWMSPTLTAWIGKAYSYDPDFKYWKGRVYGVFRSPLDAGLTFCMGTLVIACAPHVSKGLKALIAALSLMATALSHSATPLAASILALAGAIVPRLGRRRKATSLVGLAALILLFISLRHHSHWVELKLNDLVYRLIPWKVYVGSLLQRWDAILLGAGFTHYFTDNSYLFVLYRGGVVGMGIFVFFLARWLVRGWPNWSLAQRSLALFSPIAGIALDSLIARPLVAIWIVLVIPLLSPRKKVQ